MSFFRENVVALASALLAIGVSYGILKTEGHGTADEVHHLAERVSEIEVRVRFMEVHGHEEHERRISKLEEQKADRLSGLIEEQGKQITILAQTVGKDHDAIVRLTAVLERH